MKTYIVILENLTTGKKSQYFQSANRPSIAHRFFVKTAPKCSKITTLCNGGCITSVK